MQLFSKILTPILLVQFIALPVFAADPTSGMSQADFQKLLKSPQAAETIGQALKNENFTPIGTDGKPTSVQSIYSQKNVNNGVTLAFRSQADASREYAVQMKPIQKSDGSPALSLKLLRHTSEGSWVLVSSSARTTLSVKPGRDAAAISLDAARAMNVLEAQIVADAGVSSSAAHSWLAKISSFLLPEAQAGVGTTIANVVSYALLTIGGLMVAGGAYLLSQPGGGDVSNVVMGLGDGILIVVGLIIFAIGGGIMLITNGVNAVEARAAARRNGQG